MTAPTAQLPLVVQLGFAGSRELFDPQAHPGVDADAFEDALVPLLADRLRRMRSELGLQEHHFVCGVSQLAIGGDTVFTRALQQLGWLQRICLPQTRDAFLAAVGTEGPDFTPAQRSAAVELLASPHIIQEWVASTAADRSQRFAETAREIARVSDVVVCLLAKDGPVKPGGTADLARRARARGRPVLELWLTIVDGQPHLTDKAHSLQSFKPPVLDELLAETHLADTGDAPQETSIEAYCTALKQIGSRRANRLRDQFKAAEFRIQGTHIAATVVALVAVLSHGAARVPWLLGVELASLSVGLWVHWRLHFSERARQWALWRLVAELARSVLAVGPRHLYLHYLFVLPFPHGLRPLLETLCVLQLKETRFAAPDSAAREKYLRDRLGAADVCTPHLPDGFWSSVWHRLGCMLGRPREHSAQLPYYAFQACRARGWRMAAQWMFWCGSGGALVLTACKLLMLLHVIPVDHAAELIAANWLGGLAVLLPLAAVAALSMSAALDMEARAHVFPEMTRFLLTQRRLLNNPDLEESDFDAVLCETESRLLGETVAWYARRAYLS